jgi:hypothetical protein
VRDAAFDGRHRWRGSFIIWVFDTTFVRVGQMRF